MKSIAFPSISTGAFHYPKHKAAAVASLAIKEYLETDDKFVEVRLVFFAGSDAKMFLKHHCF